jgi:hypothetical protein
MTTYALLVDLSAVNSEAAFRFVYNLIPTTNRVVYGRTDNRLLA